MKTIIELYDRESMLNILAVCTFRPTPEHVVFIGGFSGDDEIEATREWMNSFLENKDIHTELHFVSVDVSDCSDIVDALFEAADSYPDCALEVTGGRDLALLAAGMVAENMEIPIFHYDVECHRFANVRDMEEADSYDSTFFTAGDILELAHAGAFGYSHYSPDELDLVARDDAREIWRIFFENRDCWDKIANFFKNSDTDAGNELVVNTDKIMQEMSVSERDGVLRNLAGEGLLANLNISGRKVSFKYKNKLIKTLLRTEGAPLEIFTYSCLSRAGDIFSDCEIDLRVDWDGDGPSETNNELDVIAVRNNVPVFISCKSGRNLTTAALNEIYILSRRFGGMFAKPVMMIARDRDETTIQTFIHRADDMGITVVSAGDLCEQLHRDGFHNRRACKTCVSRECEKNLVERIKAICDI